MMASKWLSKLIWAPKLTGRAANRQVPYVQDCGRIRCARRHMSTRPDQVHTLQEAAARTRGAVGDGRFPSLMDEALEIFGADLQTHMGRADTSSLFTPLEVWTGYEWEPAAFVGLQDRGVVAWGKGQPRTQVIPRAEVKHVVETDVRPDDVTLWVDCEQPISLRVTRFAPGMDVPQAVHDALAPFARAAPAVDIDDRADLICPSCGGAVREGADFCPHCGHPMTKAKGFNKRWLFLLIPLAVIVAVVLVFLLTRDTAVKDTPASPSATPPAGPTATVARASINLTRRISGPGWQGRAPGDGWKIGPEQKLS